tara:strand:- start:389 stop:763 length:375 start_codon:yes stop_codon:yes gene_type:complete
MANYEDKKTGDGAVDMQRDFITIDSSETYEVASFEELQKLGNLFAKAAHGIVHLDNINNDTIDMYKPDPNQVKFEWDATELPSLLDGKLLDFGVRGGELYTNADGDTLSVKTGMPKFPSHAFNR